MADLPPAWNLFYLTEYDFWCHIESWDVSVTATFDKKSHIRADDGQIILLLVNSYACGGEVDVEFSDFVRL